MSVPSIGNAFGLSMEVGSSVMIEGDGVSSLNGCHGSVGVGVPIPGVSHRILVRTGLGAKRVGSLSSEK